MKFNEIVILLTINIYRKIFVINFFQINFIIKIFVYKNLYFELSLIWSFSFKLKYILRSFILLHFFLSIEKIIEDKYPTL